jgi:copper(I)-binding protein
VTAAVVARRASPPRWSGGRASTLLADQRPRDGYGEGNEAVSRSTSRSAGAIGILVAAMLLAGCGTGQTSQTASTRSGIDGVNAKIGDILVRDMLIERPAGNEEAYWKTGSEVPLSLRIVNQGEEPDRLIGVVTNAASGIALRQGEATESPSPSVSASASASPSPSASASASPSASASASASPSASASASPSVSASASPSAAPSGSASPSLAPDCTDRVSVDIAPGKRVALAPDAAQYVVLCATVEEIRATNPIAIVLVFEKAGRQQIAVPLQSPEEPLERESPEGEGE